MSNASPEVLEESLDPDDWESLRTLGRRMIDDLITYHSELRDRPAWKPAPRSRARGWSWACLPRGSERTRRTRSSFASSPYVYGNLHSRGWGWVNGTGTTIGALAELWAAAMNSNAWAGNHSAPIVETVVLGWLRQMLGVLANKD